MDKRIAICLSLMVILYLFACLAAAQTDVLRVSPTESTVLDRTTLERWTLEEFERDNVKLLVGHEIEVNFVLHRRVSDVPDSYYLELRTDMDNPDWNYEGTHYRGSPVTVWNSSFEHAKSAIRIGLTAKVPDTLIISNVKEPYFEECPLTGIGEKKYYFELTVYNRGAFVGTAERTDFFATSSRLVDMTTEIKEGLKSAHDAGVDYPESEQIYKLLEGGHPGWAYSLYKSLNVSSNQELIDMKKTMEANFEKAREKGVNNPSLVMHIRNLFENGNPEEALDLSEEYVNTPAPPPLWMYAIIFVIALAIGIVASYYIIRSVGNEQINRLQGLLEGQSESLDSTIEKIRNLETNETNPDKRRELRRIKEDLEDAKGKIRI